VRWRHVGLSASDGAATVAPVAGGAAEGPNAALADGAAAVDLAASGASDGLARNPAGYAGVNCTGHGGGHG
jgi:hypothetical protein